MPITKWDEYLIHQTYDTIDAGEVEDDRFLLSYHSIDGRLHMTTGLGAYPKENIMDGYVCIRHEGTQYNLRFSRHLQGDRADTVIGPFTVKVLEPLRRWGIYLDENDYGMGCSVEFEGRNAPYYYGNTSITLPFIHYTQAGRYRGSITLDKEKFDLDGFIGVRDRTWRARLGKILESSRPFGGHMWIQVHFADFFLTLVGVSWWEDPDQQFNGAMVFDDGRVVPVTNVRHKVEFVPGIRVVSRMELLLTCADGKKRHLSAATKSPALYLVGGGYDHGSPGSLGTDRGSLHIDGERWDVSTPADLFGSTYYGASGRGIAEYIADFQLDGKPGTGIWEVSYTPDKDLEYRPTL